MKLTKDYYKMEGEELLQAIKDMRGWLMKFPTHELHAKVLFALSVACSARDILKDKKEDPSVQEVINIFTEIT